VLADETRQGKSVIAKLDPSLVESAPDQVIGKQGAIPVLDQKPTSDHHKQSSDSDSFTAESLVIDMGIVSQVGSEFAKEFSSLETRSVHEQVTSSIKEMLVQQNNSGKQEITINLFPEKLGAVKVEIISVLGEDGARKVESIKFIAEKRETLEILERSRLELEKSLKEVTNTGEKTSLEFEMNRDGQNSQAGAYFDSFEERSNWMNSFLTLNDIDNETIYGKISEDPSRHDVGHITEDSVDIRI
jgi:flagellar hook-length control protein FliK